jgi:hypothetical protein
MTSPAPLSTPARLATWSGLLVAVLGCGGILYRSPATVTADVEQHLSSVYGEPFVVDRVQNNSNEGHGIVDRHSWYGHPARAPDVRLRGLADYEVEPARFTDDYRCARVLPVALARWNAALTARSMAADDDRMACEDALLPLDPDPQAMIPGVLRYTGELRVFTDDPIDLDALAASMREAAVEAGLEAAPHAIVVYPEHLAGQIRDLARPNGVACERRMYARAGGSGWRADPRVRLPTVEDAVREVDAPGVIDVKACSWEPAMVAAIEADPDAALETLPENAYFATEVRLAVAEDTPAATIDAYRERLRERGIRSVTVVAGRYVDPAMPSRAGYRGGRVCDWRCEDVEGFLLPPSTTPASR